MPMYVTEERGISKTARRDSASSVCSDANGLVIPKDCGGSANDWGPDAYGRGYFDDDDATLEKILIKEEADRKGDTSVGPVRHCICKGDYCFYGRSFID